MADSAPSIVYLVLVVLAVLTAVFVQRLATLAEALWTFSPALAAVALLYARETWGIRDELAVTVAVGAQGVALALFFSAAEARDAGGRGAPGARRSARAKPPRREHARYAAPGPLPQRSDA